MSCKKYSLGSYPMVSVIIIVLIIQLSNFFVSNIAECKSLYGKRASGGIVDHMLCAAHPGRDACSVRMFG